MSRPTFLGCHFNVFQRVFQPSDVSGRNCGPVVVREAAPYHSLAHESRVNFLQYHGQGEKTGIPLQLRSHRNLIHLFPDF